MASIDRPVTPARTARLILLSLVLVALVATLWVMLDKRLGAAQAAAPRPPTEPAASSRRLIEPDAVLEARVRAAISKAVTKASKETKGAVSASNSVVAVSVRELGYQGELVAVQSNRAVRPASNLKLVTSAAALAGFGANGALVTTFEASTAPVKGVLSGDLVVRAGGDPLHDRAAKGDCAAWCARLATQLKASGVQRVRGAIVLDEGEWLQPGPGPAWPDKSQYWQEHCALAGGFSVNGGCITATVRPTQPGSKARVEVLPRGTGLPERIDVRTGPAGSKLDVRVGVEGGKIVVEGSIPASTNEWSARFALPDPVDAFGKVLRHELARNGIIVDGEVRRVRRAPGGGVLVARMETPVTALLAAVNTDSNNAVADQLYFALGAKLGGEGTRKGGQMAVAKSLQDLGLLDQGWKQVDGSGLSRDNLVTARQITALIEAAMALDTASASAFHDSLAVPGEDGTLERRMGDLGERLRAKTGFINGTSALSGLVDTKNGRTLVFSILVQYPAQGGLNTSVWKPMQNEICRELARVGG